MKKLKITSRERIAWQRRFLSDVKNPVSSPESMPYYYLLKILQKMSIIEQSDFLV